MLPLFHFLMWTKIGSLIITFTIVYVLCLFHFSDYSIYWKIRTMVFFEILAMMIGCLYTSRYTHWNILSFLVQRVTKFVSVLSEESVSKSECSWTMVNYVWYGEVCRHIPMCIFFSSCLWSFGGSERSIQNRRVIVSSDVKLDDCVIL